MPNLRALSLGTALGLSVALGSCEAAVDQGGRSDLGRPGGVEVFVTARNGDRIQPHQTLAFASGRLAPIPIVAVNDEEEFQTIAGFGASFLEAGLVTLNSLPSGEEQDAVLRRLFDPVDGAGFTLMKTVIGGTDFQSARPEWFTYADTPGDTELATFSISRDLERNGVLTFIERARAFGDFKLQASMDYPPDWMLVSVTDKPNQNVAAEFYPVLAQYYLRYLLEYESQGVHIDYLSMFNEPGVYTKIPATDVNVLLRDHVGPVLEAAGVTTAIIPAEVPLRIHAMAYYAPILADPDTRAFIDVLGYHGYWGDGANVVAQLHRSEPGIPMWMTEICCMHAPGITNATPKTYDNGDNWARQIFDDLEAGASAWIYWNMILDEQGGPWLVDPTHENGDPNSQPAVVHIDRTSHEITYTALYYYLSHFSRFVRPGAVRVGASLADPPAGLRALAFRNIDGSIVVQLLNSEESARPVAVAWHGEWIRVQLAGKSITTLRWQGHSN